MPPTSTVISGAVSVSMCARSTSSSSADLVCRSEVVAEPVGGRFEHGKRVDVGLLLRGVRAPRREGNLHVVPGVLRSLLDGCAPAQHDQVGERDLLPARLRAVELLLDRLQGLQHLPQFGRLVDLPVLLRREADARPVRSTALVGAAEGRRRRPGGRDQLGDGQARREDLALEGSDVLRLRSTHASTRGRGPATTAAPPEPAGRDTACEGPCRGASACTTPGESVCELLRVLVEALRNRLVDRVHPQREVRRQHDRGVPLRRVVRIRHGALRRHPSASTAAHRQGSSSAPTRSRTGCRRSCCPTAPVRWSRRLPARW